MKKLRIKIYGGKTKLKEQNMGRNDDGKEGKSMQE